LGLGGPGVAARREKLHEAASNHWDFLAVVFIGCRREDAFERCAGDEGCGNSSRENGEGGGKDIGVVRRLECLGEATRGLGIFCFWGLAVV